MGDLDGVLVSSDRTAVRTVLNGPPRGRGLVDERPIEAAFATGPRPR
ncbi:hypothetical protein ABTZ93_15205 [Streptomyces sp. NPDC097941]